MTVRACDLDPGSSHIMTRGDHRQAHMSTLARLQYIGWIALLMGCCHGDHRDLVDPTADSQFAAPSGESLAFGVREGNLRNYFHRQGPTAAHLLTRSGSEP